MEYASRTPDEVVEAALVRIRRDQQARHLQRRTAQGDSRAASIDVAARSRYLDALEGADEGLSISEIADAIGVDRPRSSRLTSALVEDGLVAREASPGDARYKRVRLTARGREYVSAMHLNRRRSVNEALAGFTAEESGAFAMLLERFVDAWPREPR